jgi:hypothetical protein
MLTQKIIEEIIKNKNNIKISVAYYETGPLLIKLIGIQYLTLNRIMVNNTFIIDLKNGSITFSILTKDKDYKHMHILKAKKKTIKKTLLEELMLALL